MRLYLAQHGEALPKEIDPNRPLSEKGRLDVTKLSHFLKGRLELSLVLHSGKARAKETAELLLSEYTEPPEMVEFPTLQPRDDPKDLITWLETREGDVLAVGHLPYHSRLTARLITGTSETAIVSFVPGGMVCLERCDDSGWSIQWVLRPDLL